MLRDPIIPTTTNTRIQIHINIIQSKRELRSNTRRRNQIMDRELNQTKIISFREIYPYLCIHRATFSRSRLFADFALIEIFTRALRHRRRVTNQTRRKIHLNIMRFPTSRRFITRTTTNTIRRERQGKSIRMRTSLRIDRPIRVREPAIQASKPQTRRRRTEMNRDRRNSRRHNTTTRNHHTIHTFTRGVTSNLHRNHKPTRKPSRTLSTQLTSHNFRADTTTTTRRFQTFRESIDQGRPGRARCCTDVIHIQNQTPFATRRQIGRAETPHHLPPRMRFFSKRRRTRTQRDTGKRAQRNQGGEEITAGAPGQTRQL